MVSSPRKAREESLRIAAEVLRSRLGLVSDDTHTSSLETLCLSAVSQGVMSKDEGEWLRRECLLGEAAKGPTVASTVAMIVRIIAALDN